jgi:hypothetical protein
VFWKAAASQETDVQIRNLNVQQQGDNSCENVSECKHLGTILTNRNDVCDEIRRRINSVNASCYSAGKLLLVLVLKH